MVLPDRHAHAEPWDVGADLAGAIMSSVFIQWKGTDVCCDLHCVCGHHAHYDGYFAYNLRCPKCETVWKMPDTFEIKPSTDDKSILDAIED